MDELKIDVTGCDANDINNILEYADFIKAKKSITAAAQPGTLPEFKKVLVVDDEQEICELLYSFLSNYKYKVFLAFNAQMGLKFFQEVNPDIVLLDLKMPDMDGVNLLKMMRLSKTTPTVIITGHPEFVSEVRSAALTVEGYLEKPLILEKTLKMMRRILGNI